MFSKHQNPATDNVGTGHDTVMKYKALLVEVEVPDYDLMEKEGCRWLLHSS
ncbi:MAG: hypothetical protein R3B41_02735 [Candidatus Doudnabacteria bacterium]